MVESLKLSDVELQQTLKPFYQRAAEAEVSLVTYFRISFVVMYFVSYYCFFPIVFGPPSFEFLKIVF